MQSTCAAAEHQAHRSASGVCSNNADAVSTASAPMELLSDQHQYCILQIAFRGETLLPLKFEDLMVLTALERLERLDALCIGIAEDMAKRSQSTPLCFYSARMEGTTSPVSSAASQASMAGEMIVLPYSATARKFSVCSRLGHCGEALMTHFPNTGQKPERASSGPAFDAHQNDVGGSSPKSPRKMVSDPLDSRVRRVQLAAEHGSRPRSLAILIGCGITARYLQSGWTRAYTGGFC